MRMRSSEIIEIKAIRMTVPIIYQNEDCQPKGDNLHLVSAQSGRLATEELKSNEPLRD